MNVMHEPATPELIGPRSVGVVTAEVVRDGYGVHGGVVVGGTVVGGGVGKTGVANLPVTVLQSG